MKRRDIIRSLSLVPFAGGIISTIFPTASAIAAPVKKKRDIFKELGLRTFINAAGTYTAMTASLMPDEVLEVINNSAKEFAMLDEVQDKVGEKIAALVHAEAATVTAGCWSALVLGTAGVLTGTDPKRIAQLPRLEGTGMKSQVIVQKAHNVGYVHALTNTGISIVPVETREEAEQAVNDQTAMFWFLNSNTALGKIGHQEWVDIAHKFQIPVMIDIAADVPPVENLWKYNDMGFDLVCLSGGKAICGPQSAGILMGKKDLIAAARLSAPPRGANIGRGMKVNKEEILGMYVALEKFINQDHAKEWKMLEDRVANIENAVKDIDGVTTKVSVPEVTNRTPTLTIAWDINKVKISREVLAENLRKANPSVEVISWEDGNNIRITTFMLKPGQDKIVAARIREQFIAAAK